jgi:[ribosomal protein S18]-alanine N-acetyltransferase
MCIKAGVLEVRMPPITIREATAADVAFLQAMLWEAILASPSLIRAMGLEQLQEVEDQYWGSWANKQDPAFIAVDADGKSVGMILLKRNLDEAVASWRLGIAVAPERRGQGIGRLLLRAAATFVRARAGTYLNLLVDPENAPAMALYRQEGFQEMGEVNHLIEMRITF